MNATTSSQQQQEQHPEHQQPEPHQTEHQQAALSVETSRFGNITILPERVLTFVKPILGFEHLDTYTLLDHAPESPFKWLQSLENPTLAFVVTDPREFGFNYEFALADEYVETLQIQAAGDVLVLTIVNIPDEDPGKMTANMMAPLIINLANRQAGQIVLNDTDYAIKTRLIPDELLNSPNQ